MFWFFDVDRLVFYLNRYRFFSTAFFVSVLKKIEKKIILRLVAIFVCIYLRNKNTIFVDNIGHR